MKNLFFISLFLCSSILSVYSQGSTIPKKYRPKKVLQHIKLGVVGTYSINHLKKPHNLWGKYGLFHDANIGLSALYEYRKGIHFKVGVSLKQYRLTIPTKGWNPIHQSPYDIKHQLNYISFDAGFLFDIRKTKTGIGLTYYLERYLSQTHNYGNQNRDWHYYIAYHHILGLSYYYQPSSSFFISFDLKSSLSALGLGVGKAPVVFSDKFLVFGVGVSARYYLVRRKKK
ncbi:MAG: hypothetical protein ACPG5B_11600 [Chitinophagales bacterium]